MIRLFRAASFAAAAVVFVFGAPSSAWELTGTPLTTEIAESPAEIAAGLGATPPIVSAQPSAPLEPASVAPPEQPARRSLAELVAEHAGTETSDAQQECLAGAVYFEAKGEPLSGQLSVAEVTLNRGGRFPAIARASFAWKRAVAIAHIAVQNLADGPAPKALFFHAKRVSP